MAVRATHVSTGTDHTACILCGQRHNAKYATCFMCRTHPLDEDLRVDILIRDSFTCRGCREIDGAALVVHIKPISKGGLSQPWNLHLLCHACTVVQGHEWQRGSLRDRARTMLMHRYFTFGWCMLDEVQREALRIDAKEYHSEFKHHCRYTGVVRSDRCSDEYYDGLMNEFGDSA